MNAKSKWNITVEAAIFAFGTGRALAKALGITPQAITAWGAFIPELRAYQLRDTCPVEFKVMVTRKAA